MTLTGSLYCALAVSAFCMIDSQKEKVNQMNVFPVPDGDTGINMSLTMSTLTEIEEELSLSACALAVADRMLRAARGNSGAILSLFFRGVAKAFSGCDTADAAILASAFSRGATEAYRAVAQPKEGTVLTVMRASADAAEALVGENPDISLEELLSGVVLSAKATLEKTPEMLPVLKEAGVVDAGGFGFVLALEGMLAAAKGTPLTAPTAGAASFEANFSEFHTEDIVFAYCTECIVEKSEEYLGENTANAFFDFVREIGDSVVFVDDERIIKLHVHTNDPGAVLSHAIVYGALSSVKIENMRLQHTALTEDAKNPPKKTAVSHLPPAPVTKKFGFVSVCMGEGIKNTFLDLGVDAVIEGGQTMNPSTQDIMDAVLSVGAETVFVLPNNKNICMVARQAAEMTDARRVLTVPTETVAEGISALLAFDGDLYSTENEAVAAMKEAYKGVTTMAVTYAVRDTSVGRFRIAKGQYLGIVEDVIACVSKSSRECITELIRGMTGATYVTLFYGESISADEAEAVGATIRERVGEACEVVVIAGGQPIYDYIVSVEQG